MKKVLGITLMTFGLLFVAIFGTSIYMVGSEENSDEWVIEDCERRVSAGEYARWDEEAMDRCIGDGFKALAGVGAFLLFGIALGLTWSIKFIIFLINIIYTIWALVSIWNCAYNVKNKIWGDLSRVIVVLNVILLFLIYTGIISFDYQNIVQKNS